MTNGFAAVDNYVYAWGDGDNGRLGCGPMELGKGPNKKSASLPRPIFGALHIVPHLSARHWHTILIAGLFVYSSNNKFFCLLKITFVYSLMTITVVLH